MIGSGAMVIGLFFMVIGLIVSGILKSKIAKYQQIPVKGGLTGKDIAERMLSENGIHDVQVVSVPGRLSDHYNPLNKTINLSEDVYSQSNVSAAAVAAHECGHAVQHATQYSWLSMRSQLAPVVGFASGWVMWIILAGLIIAGSLGQTLLLAGIILFGLITLFSFITLPVEIDASNRAIKWLQGSSVGGTMEMGNARDALNWAGYTYVVAAVGSLATLVYYILLFMGRRSE